MHKASYQQQVYRRVHVETANPGRVLLTLYDAAIRFVRLAKKQIESGNAAAKGVTLSRAYAIIAEFIHALDFEKAPQLCENLEQIYGFMLNQMAQANANMDAEALEPVLTFLVDLRETWAEAVKRSAHESTNQDVASSSL